MANELERIVKDSGLEVTKAQMILTQFQDYFDIAAEWENKAKTIVVTRDDQTAEMQLARTGRLFLKDKRTAIEKARKELKEQSLREGKAIDGVANVLKGLIEPIEKYLDEQEHFVELKKKKEDEILRLEVEKRMQAERLEKEKQEREAIEKLRIENQLLQSELHKKELEKMRDDANRKAQEKAIQDAKDKVLLEAQNKVDKAIEETKTLIQEEKDKIMNLVQQDIKCPYCHRSFRLSDAEV